MNIAKRQIEYYNHVDFISDYSIFALEMMENDLYANKNSILLMLSAN